MATNDLFTFYPSFSEFLPVYRDVVQIWVGDGVSTGTAGMLYARYQDESVAEIGSVSLYETAVRNGFNGTPAQWVQAIANMAQLIRGSEVSFSYQVSTDGVNHPAENSQWSSVPVYEQGKFTWVKINLTWVDGSITPLYVPTYQGRDGVVTTVNGEIGDVFLHGENLLISLNSEQSIKDYIDENDIPYTATQEDIDSMFSMALFSGAVFISGRRFETGDSVTLSISAVTPGAPLPLETTTTIYPTGGNSWHYGLGTVLYNSTDIPTGETTQEYVYKIKETAHTISGVDIDPTEHLVTITLTDMGDGTVRIEKSSNYNALYFSHTYSALGRVVFSGTIAVDGRSMAAREFMVQIKEGNTVVAENISTAQAAASGQGAAIVFPPINYTLDDIGTHVYTVKETSTSGDGITIDDTEYTVTVTVLDEIRDGALEIVTNDTELNLDFVNVYQASGTVTFEGIKTLTHRVFKNTDTYSVSITGNGKLPSPATASVVIPVGESVAEFEFQPITYTLTDMRNVISGYDDEKLFTYTVNETANIPGVTPDGITHTISVRVVDNKRGQLVVTATYSDGICVSFGGTYDAQGSITIVGTKNLENRKFVATDTMSVSLTATNSGKLPYVSTINVPLTVGQNSVNFSFMELTFTLADIQYLASKTFSYVCQEATVITGATNDALTHTLDITIVDNEDGTLTVTPTYSDGQRFIFTSIYNASGSIILTGTKTLANRNFRNEDVLSVAITATDGGRLPNPSSVSVPLTTTTNVANFNFAQITYNVSDLDGLASKVFNYVATETCTMAGTTTSATTDPIVITISDNSDGTLSVVPTYTSNNKITFTNVYAATGSLSFKVREIITNGSLSTQSFTARITQVTGNNSTVQASSNVVLANPVTMTANQNASQDLDFTNIVSFAKNSLRDDTQATYWFLIEQVLPTLDANNVNNNVRYDVSKKWISVSVSDNANGTLNVVKVPSADAVTGLDMTFTNEQLGSLTITNTWTGDDSSLTTVQKNAFTFAVTGPNSYSNSFVYSAMTNNSITFDGLTLGEYVVTETNNVIENFTITTSYLTGGTATNHVTLTNGTAKTMAVTNSVNKLEGSLTITKAFSGDDNLLTSTQKNGITFTVTGPKQISTDATTYSSTFTYGDMTQGVYTINHLTLGTYTVTESNNTISGLDCTTAYLVDYTATNSATVTDGSNTVVSVSNAYAQQVGYVRVYASFVNGTMPQNFQITNNYNDTVFTSANGQDTGTHLGYLWTIQNVPVGTVIQFTESNYDITNYTHSGIIVLNCYAVAQNTPSNVYFTNTYTSNSTLVGRTFTFNNDPSSNTAVEVNAHFTDAGSNAYTALKYVPSGQVDNILEYYPSEGYNYEAAYRWDDIGSNIWTSNDKKTITFTSDPTTFTTGVTTVAEFETWLLTVATEQI